MLLNILPNFILHHTLFKFNIIQTFFDFLLKRAFEVKFVNAVEWDDGVQKVGRVKTLRTDLFLTFQAKKYKVLIMNLAHRNRLVNFILIYLRLMNTHF